MIDLLIAADFLEEHNWHHVAGILRVPRVFFTGSRIYGTPHAYSDYDLVINMPNKTESNLLIAAAMNNLTLGSRGTIRFGNLNIIVTDTEIYHRTWYQGTLELIAKKPVTRNQAIAHFETKFFENCPDKSKINHELYTRWLQEENSQEITDWLQQMSDRYLVS